MSLKQRFSGIIKNYTGAAAVNVAFNPGIDKKWILKEINIHVSATGTGTLTVTKDANAGAAYDQLIASQDMSSVTDTYRLTEIDTILSPDDYIDIVWANSTTKTYGIDIIWAPAI